ncbi:MAG: DUF1446 domain-containing protein [Sphingomonadaceae bacterium]|nr:DUF1446 domain-containing protein [Sphingomonadaceae bacterium]
MAKTGKVVRIGGGTAFFDDSFIGHPALIAAKCDYIVYDYLAELTMASLSSDTKTNPEGFSPNLLRDMAPFLKDMIGSGTRIITNWGGLNPQGAADALRKLLAELGLTAKIGIVTGDDMRGRVDEFHAQGLREMFSGEPLPDDVNFSSMNAYFGGFPIAAALDAGADIVLTGRAVDSALALGPLIHEFGWTPDDWDLLSAGTLVGHLTECSTQVTGGTFTDWESIPDPANIGNPFVDCHSDGTFVVSKPEGTGGLVSTGTVAEQMIYEVSDPQAYIVPDAVCDWSEVVMAPDGPNRVRVRGAKGYAPTSTYKVCATYSQGWRGTAFQPIVGINAPAKARRQAEALFERTNTLLRNRNAKPLNETHVEVIGAETSYGPRSRGENAREVVAMISVTHDEPIGPQIFLKEQVSSISSMSPGTTIGLGGNLGSTRPLMRVFLFLVNKSDFTPQVSVDGQAVALTAAPSRWFEESMLARPPEPAHPTNAEPELTVPLISLAWARSGDKGNLFNVGVFAREPRFAPYIAAALDQHTVGQWYAHLLSDAEPQIDRFVMPGTHGLNFVVKNSLQGGGAQSLRLDPVAKSMGQMLLEYPVPVSKEIAESLGLPETA